MYPFTSVRWAWEALWDQVHQRAPWTPDSLTFTNDVHASWNDPLSVVNHVCGWPLAKFHAHDHQVVGAFALAVPTAEGHSYRSTLVATRPAPIDELLARGVTVAANSPDSLSGWVSLLAVNGGQPYTGRVLFTGAHIESLRLLQTGRAVVACIDSWSLALLDVEQPHLTADLHRIGNGPLIPTPAITVRDSVTRVQLEQLGDAIEFATRDPGNEQIFAALMIAGFDQLTLDDYLPVLDLATW